MAAIDSGLSDDQLKIHREFEARLALREKERKKVRDEQRSGFGEHMNPAERKAHFDTILAGLDSELDNVRGIAGIRAVEAKITELESLGISKGELAGPRSRLSQITQQLALGEKEKKQGRKKFTFKKREKKGTTMAVEAKVETAAKEGKAAELQEQLKRLAEGNQFVITTAGTFDIPQDSDVLIKNVHGTDAQTVTIKIDHTRAGTVHVQNISHVTIHCAVNTSMFLDQAKNSQIHVACQQLRMHNSKDVTVHLDCSTRAIIEDSSAILFKRLAESTPESHWKTNIDDFNWLSTTDHSPNFAVCD